MTQPAESAPVVGRDEARFTFEIRHYCPSDHPEAELFLSLADEALATPLGESAGPQLYDITLPSHALRSVQPAIVCSRSDQARRETEPGGRIVWRPAGMSAYATLICRGDSGALTGATLRVPVDVGIRCGH